MGEGGGVKRSFESVDIQRVKIREIMVETAYRFLFASFQFPKVEPRFLSLCRTDRLSDHTSAVIVNREFIGEFGQWYKLKP